MNPYYSDNHIRIYNKSCRSMDELPDESVDLIVTDPPYGISFMGQDWDTFNEVVPPQGAYQHKKGFKKLPRQNTASMTKFFVPIWGECLRVLKPGAFAFVMCSPRADVMSRQICCLQNAGFNVGFSPIYHTFAQGFPKAENISLAIDRKECRKQLTQKLGTKPTKEEFKEAWKVFREVVGQKVRGDVEKAKGSGTTFAVADANKNNKDIFGYGIEDITLPATPQAKALDGSYGGAQFKPAVEVILVCMKPRSEKTFVDQALKDGKGITWLDSCRIPYESEGDKEDARFGTQMDIRGNNLKTPIGVRGRNVLSSQSGRFPANLLVSDDVLNDGKVTKSGMAEIGTGHDYDTTVYGKFAHRRITSNYQDSGSFSRYFDLDAWWAERIKQLPQSVQRTFPFLIVPKASKSEKNRGVGIAVPRAKHSSTPRKNEAENKSPNPHPTVKPVKLMSYLITLGSRQGDTVLDPFIGSGTTAIACQILGRRCTGYEIKPGYCEIAKGRLTRCRQQAML